jgi:hypothetical protein
MIRQGLHTMQRSAKLTLLLLVLVTVLPVSASYLSFFFWQPRHTVNYGELLTPAQLPQASLTGLAGRGNIDRVTMNGRWTLVYAAPARCDADCGLALYATRQTRLAQGKGMRRLARLWLVTDGRAPDERLLRGHADLEIAQADSGWLAVMPEATSAVHVFLVDPRGNVMMRFPARPDIGQVITDVQRLLKFSGVG